MSNTKDLTIVLRQAFYHLEIFTFLREKQTHLYCVTKKRERNRNRERERERERERKESQIKWNKKWHCGRRRETSIRSLRCTFPHSAGNKYSRFSRKSRDRESEKCIKQTGLLATVEGNYFWRMCICVSTKIHFTHVRTSYARART